MKLVISDETVEIAAAAIANARSMRAMQCGTPKIIANIMEVLPQELKDEVRQDARAAIEALCHDRINRPKLGTALRAMAAELVKREDPKTGVCSHLDNDAAELLRVLARIVEGKPVAKSFGAPGDWGYGTAIGDALAGRE